MDDVMIDEDVFHPHLRCSKAKELHLCALALPPRPVSHPCRPTVAEIQRCRMARRKKKKE